MDEPKSGKISEGVELGLIFIIYLGLAFITTFFSVATVYTIKTRFEGGDATFFQSLGFACSRFHLIILWSLVSATVGLILKLIGNMPVGTELTGEKGWFAQ